MSPPTSRNSLQRNRDAVEVATGTAVARDHAAYRELVVGNFDRLLGQDLAQSRRALADVEGGGKLGALGAPP